MEEKQIQIEQMDFFLSFVTISNWLWNSVVD